MDNPFWLEEELKKGARERWCMNRGCTTCGSFQMTELLTGKPWPPRGSFVFVLETLTWERAELVVEGLKNCGPSTPRDAIMWMLQMIWQRFGERAHSGLFPELSGTHSGDVLFAMRAHYVEKLERRRLHDLRQGLKKKDWPE